MSEDITLLDDLQAKNVDIIKQAEELKNKMMDFKEKIKEDVNKVIERTPLLISHSQRVPTNLDSEDIESYQLPPPIIPQVRIMRYNLSIITLSFFTLILNSLIDISTFCRQYEWRCNDGSIKRFNENVISGRFCNAVANIRLSILYRRR